MIRFYILLKGYIISYIPFFIIFLLCINRSYTQNHFIESQNALQDSCFTVDIHRRASEFFRRPNFFVRCMQSQNVCTYMELKLSSNDSIKLQLDLEEFICSRFFCLGRNHLNYKTEYIKYWSHHTPKIYTLNIMTKNNAQEITYNKDIQVGIVDYRMMDEELLVNNKRELFKSLVISEPIDSLTITEFKKNHVNTLIFNYVPNIDLIKITDQLGIYVMIDLRKTNRLTMKSKLLKIKNHPSISYFLKENENDKGFLERHFPHIPINLTLPKNSLILSLKELSLKKIRDIFQPFEIIAEPLCTDEQSGLLISINATETFNYWKKTKLICKVTDPLNGDTNLLSVIPNKTHKVFVESPCSSLKQLEYTVLLKATQEFSAFNPSDTISFFMKK